MDIVDEQFEAAMQRLAQEFFDLVLKRYRCCGAADTSRQLSNETGTIQLASISLAFMQYENTSFDTPFTDAVLDYSLGSHVANRCIEGSTCIDLQAEVPTVEW